METFFPMDAEYQISEYDEYEYEEYEDSVYGPGDYAEKNAEAYSDDYGEAYAENPYPGYAYSEYGYYEYDGSYEAANSTPYPNTFFFPGVSFPVLAVLLVSAVLALAFSNVTPAIALPQVTAVPEVQESPAPVVETNTSENAAPAITGAISGQLAPLFTPEIQHWGSQIVQWAQDWNLDPNLVATVMQIESCGNPSAVSSAGAMGLFQVMPFHFSGGEDGHDVQTNARRGLSYLRQSLNAHGGQERLALAGYNGGINGSKRPESQWANETQRYVYWGYGIYEDARQGKSQSQSLDEWLGRGGSSLCAKAGQYLGLY